MSVPPYWRSSSPAHPFRFSRPRLCNWFPIPRMHTLNSDIRVCRNSPPIFLLRSSTDSALCGLAMWKLSWIFGASLGGGCELGQARSLAEKKRLLASPGRSKAQLADLGLRTPFNCRLQKFGKRK